MADHHVGARQGGTRRLILRGVSSMALIGLAAAPGHGETLNPTYSPAANNGGGANPGRADIVALANQTDTITGDYSLRGTSARRFLFNTSTLADRNAMGEVVSGYAAIDGKGALPLGAEQKTTTITYPDQIQGTRVATLVYDNARLAETPGTSTLVNNLTDTRRPVYGDLRLADISNSVVTIATGDRARSVYDASNFALLTADSGSTLYNVTAGSSITYDSRTATMSGADQDGISQPATRAYAVPITTYSGVAFGGNDSVTDLASLKRYNAGLIAQLSAGTITPAQYESLIQSAAITTNQQVTVRNEPIPLYRAPATTSDRVFIKLDNSRLTTTAASQLVGVVVADGNVDGGNILILAENGATVVNNGNIAQAGMGAAVRLDGLGTSLTNAATGVIGVGYETLARAGGSLTPTGLAGQGYSTGNSAIEASDRATVANAGIINVANRDIPGGVLSQPGDQTVGKANAGIVVSGGAAATNSGTILIGGADSATANAPGRFQGAAGIVAFDGGTATNAAGGTIRVGTSFAETAADLANVTDVGSLHNW